MSNKKQRVRIYYPRCRSCAYAKENKLWQKQLLRTQWFDKDSPETVADFYKRTAPPVPYLAFHRHLENHTAISRMRSERAKKLIEEGKIAQRKPDLVPSLVTDVIVEANTDHEAALDDVIRKFHTAVRNNKIPITMSHGLQAIKIKADIDKSNKERKVDLMKLFSGRGNGKADSTDS